MQQAAGSVQRWVVAPLLVVLLTSCGSDQTEIVVSAAASLTDAFTEIEAAFESAHPGTDVTLNFGGSSILREQILGGAPVDVFASANRATMDDIVEAGAATTIPSRFATNRLVIGVPLGNPSGVTGLADLARQELAVGLCDVPVPCGSFARAALDAAGVDPSLDTEEPNVRSVLTKLAAGELDAGIVYLTDAATGTIDSIPIPEEYNQVAEYFIAPLAESSQPGIGEEFVSFVLSEEGQTILASYGFGPQ